MSVKFTCIRRCTADQIDACACAAFARESEAERLLWEWFYANSDFDMDDWNRRTRNFFEDRELDGDPGAA